MVTIRRNVAKSIFGKKKYSPSVSNACIRVRMIKKTKDMISSFLFVLSSKRPKIMSTVKRTIWNIIFDMI